MEDKLLAGALAVAGLLLVGGGFIGMRGGSLLGAAFFVGGLLACAIAWHLLQAQRQAKADQSGRPSRRAGAAAAARSQRRSRAATATAGRRSSKGATQSPAKAVATGRAGNGRSLPRNRKAPQ